MEKLASVSIDEKEQIYLNGKLLENVVAYKLENSASSKEPAKLTVTMFVNVGQGCCATLKESLGMQYKDKAFYKDLITQKAEAQTLLEDLVQKMSKERPDVVLACIGIHHPASEVVLQYLSSKVYQEWKTKDSALLVNPWSEIIKRGAF